MNNPPDDKPVHLVLVRPHLDDVPPLSLPPGYHMRTFQPGDEDAWDHIVAVAFQNHSRRFPTYIRGNMAFRPERIFFLLHNAEPVGTASAWHVADDGPDTGRLHMLAILPEHQGKKLSIPLSTAVLRQFIREGRTRARLHTHDDRLAAIAVYLRIGFEPLLVHDNQRQRWRDVFRHMHREDELTTRFHTILNGPITPMPAG